MCTNLKNNKKTRFIKAFWSVIQRVEIIYIFKDNVCILCLSYKIKRFIISANLTGKMPSQRLNGFPVCSITILTVQLQPGNQNLYSRRIKDTNNCMLLLYNKQINCRASTRISVVNMLQFDTRVSRLANPYVY